MELSISAIMAQKLQYNSVLNPITALAFQDAGETTYLLVAEDTWLGVYDLATSRPLGQLKIFYSQPIHGIHVSDSESSPANEESGVLIWGGQSVTVLPLSSLHALAQGATPSPPIELKAPDWIYDGILFPAGTSKGALITAHNEILPFLVSDDGHGLTFGSLTSPSRPILYSANLCRLDSNTILVAGGTVFGEIIVWKYYFDSSQPSQWEVLYVFTGHEGSIFGVSISGEIEIAPGVTIRLLASCSDDRTIRIWDVTDRQVSAPEGQEIDSKALAEARETGFGDNSEAKEENKNDSSRCLAVSMGHLSRIWHVKFGRSNQVINGPIEIFSFGEDTTRQRWELTLDLEKWKGRLTSDSESIATLQNCSTSSCHNGKNIWSAAVSVKGGQEPLIATGGADGKVVISGSRTGDTTQKYAHLDLTISLEDVLEQLQSSHKLSTMTVEEPMTKKGVKYAFQKYSFLSDDTLMATATSGRLFLANIANSVNWDEVHVSETVTADLRSYMVMKAPVKNSVILGGATGKVYLYRKGHGVSELAHFSGKISDIILLQDYQTEEERSWSVIITVLSLDHAVILNFDPSSGKSTTDPRKIVLTDHCIITASAFAGSSLIVGSRTGALTVHNTTSDSSDFIPLTSRRDPKGKDAITAISILPGSTNSFLAACRDGKYRIYTLSSSDKDPSLHLQHEISPPLGMIEGAWFSPINATETQLILHGFRGKHFVVWNESTRTVLASIECGGAHRPYACISPSTDPNQLRLVFTKASQMRLYSQPAPFLHTLKEGGHGREIRAIAASPSGQYVVTAAEDTNIRIWQSSPNQPLKCLAIIEKHSAGIQSMKWFNENYLITSAGSEELYIWRIARLNSSYDGLAVVCEAVWTDGTKDGDLRIVDFDLRHSSFDDTILIALVLSNSEMRTYTYSPAGQEFIFLSKGLYTGACPTQVRYISGTEHILTGYTDGHLALWHESTQNPSELKLSHPPIKIHQSSIKTLDLVADNNKWVIATGGDDNALGFVDLVYDSTGQGFSVEGRYRVKSAHAAAVTGLCAVSTSEKGVIVVVSVSNDQRVKLWRGEGGRGGFKVKLLDNKYSSVADAGDVEVITSEGSGGRRVIVGGVGMEVWDLE
ncbi:putative cytosolic iron-sulfur protein assembly protein 1 [Podospora fimiseda]|uniref:Cytosolic iron-sulfur protein assembly protein 1 n=1 Tax=Podospora fimiseda TaxID=252190 RepID=A0AAN7BU23_9PEZI|nr:putative cytosolic iron-sulfur protein assembly protein 1 [Podospora fimiseda]